MVSDKRRGSQGGSGAARGPRPVVTRPGSVNRGFASVDPERQREPVAEGGSAAQERDEVPRARTTRTASGGAAQPTRAGRAGREPATGEDGQAQ